MASENQPAETSGASIGGGDTGVLMIGAAIVIAAWLIFDVIMGEFGYVGTYTAVAALALMSILGVGGLKLSNRTLKLLGWFMGLVGVFALIDDLRYGFPDGAADNIANIVFYIGFFVMWVGARGLKD